MGAFLIPILIVGAFWLGWRDRGATLKPGECVTLTERQQIISSGIVIEVEKGSATVESR